MVEIRILHNGEYKKLEVGRKELVRFTYQKYNLLDIQSYSTSFSQVIELEGNNNNISVLENITSLDIYKSLTNLENEIFINKKFSCVYLINDFQFDGILTISSVKKVVGSGEIVIECDIRSNEIGISELLGDKLLRSSSAEVEGLDLSELDHELNQTNILTTWDNYEGQNYYYPIINYSNILTNEMKVSDFRPAIKAKYLVDKIFDGIGLEYESSFLESEEFSNIIHPWVNIKLVGDEELEERLFNVGIVNDTEKYLTGDNFASKYRTLLFNDESSADFFDNNNNFNIVDGYNVVNNRGSYSFNLSGQYIPVIRVFNGLQSYQLTNSTLNKVTFELVRIRGGVTSILETFYSNFTFQFNNFLPTIPINSFIYDYHAYPVSFNFASTKHELKPGDIVYVRYKFKYDIRVSTISGQTLSFSSGIFFKRVNDNLTYTKFSNTAYKSDRFFIGDTISPINGIPDNVKQIDYLKSLLKHFNLVIRPDKFNKDKFLIETFDYFYDNGRVLDWTKKLDLDETIEINRIDEYIDKNILLDYDTDSAFYNVDYEELYKINYGSYRVNSYETITTDDYKIESLFSGTPCYYIPNTSVPIPQIYEVDDKGELKQSSFNMRILYRTQIYTDSSEYKDYALIPNFSISFIDDEGNVPFFLTNSLNTVLGITEFSIVNTAHHFSNPIDMNDSNDLNFGEQYIYYHHLNTPLPTENNIYNRFWKRTIDMLIDPNSTYIICSMYLTANDIFEFELGDKVIIRNNLYLINRILNWYDGETCEVELIKIIN